MTRASAKDADIAFAALADDTRRRAIRALMQEPRSAGELARSLLVSPQALSRHLRVLRKAGLVSEESLEADARVRIYRACPTALSPVQDWIGGIEALWKAQLESFRAYAESRHRLRSRRP